MSDTHRQNAVLQAIQIIADKKLSQASFDKTIKAVVKEVKDKATGEYVIKYQDSEFIAYATSSDLNYAEGEEVYILIPGNDWDRNKTIISSVNNKATTFIDVPTASSLYNRLGTNLITLKQTGQLCSYHSETKILYPSDKITVNNNVISRYIKAGNALALGMKVRTNLDSSQVGGDYGLVVNLKFKNDSDPIDISEEDAWKNAAVRSYTVSSKDVIGNPYHVRTQTMVETLIKDINIEKFLGIDSIEIFCDGFPQDANEHPADIFISGIYIYGADSLSEEDLNGYVVHIDYSKTGNILDTTENVDTVKVKAQLKAKGQVINQGAQYYWFRQNGLIFRGSPKYNGRAGDGWQCLNYYANTMAVPQNTGQFMFNNTGHDNPQGATAACFQKVNKIRCVIVYQNRAFTGDAIIYNHDARSVSIESSDKIGENNKTVYYLNNGSPTLTTIVEDYQIQNSLSYTWRIISQGSGVSSVALQTDEDYNQMLIDYQRQQAIFQSVAPADQEDYANNNQDYQNALVNYEKYLKDSRVQGNQYINFPISSIRGSSKITCAVQDGNVYIGTGSIILYNKIELQGSYSLSIDNGTQVFQYDNKGNSPATEQVKKPLEIKPLTFSLLDNTGRQISFEQIVNNGIIRWLIPRQNTLLSTKEKHQDNYNPLILVGEDKDFYNQGYDVYKNIPAFSYSIAQQYNKDKINNDIRLNIRYKDLVFDAYTDFTFPKDGDPGTNGTDFVGKVYLDSGAERLYYSRDNNNQGLFFDSLGNITNQLHFALYNNSVKIDDINEQNATWQVPPRDGENSFTSTRSHFKVNNDLRKGSLSYNTNVDTIEELPYVDIVRAKYSPDNIINYYAEFPICYEQVNDISYRIRIKPKTGFEYVVYSQDGTRPDYDNRFPFELIVERNVGNYWIADLDNLNYQWDKIGNLEIEPDKNKCTVKPSDNFDGSNLSTALTCTVFQTDQEIGNINIPIYMILNRYGHQALNDWDGNSIELNDNGNTILAPQIGAGKKEKDNSYTGVFMGAINGLEEGESEKDKQRGIDSDDYKIGFAGYHHGARTIFLDSKTGKAQFGKNNAGRITLDPSQKINGQDSALIYSGNYPIDKFIENPNVEKVGDQHINSQGQVDEDSKNRRTEGGMIIDLSTPQIGFGSGNFTVNKEGHLIARGGGQIAGWSITDNKLHKNNKVGMASSNEIIPSDTNTLKNGDTDTVAFWSGGVVNKDGTLKSANFYATHGGYIFGNLGQIAGWNFNADTFSKGIGINAVGMNSNPDLKSLNGQNGNPKAFYAGQNFYVTHNGYLKSTSGKIASWKIDSKSLTNGNVGMGEKIINKSRFNTTNNITAKFWAGNGDNNENFAVTAAGDLYSRSGKIGGWNINSNSLTAGNTHIDSTGNIYTSKWGINSDGTVRFTAGTIGGITIQNNKIGDAGGSWYISKNSVYLPNLKVTAGGAVVYNVGGSGSGTGGINGSGMHIGGGGLGSSSVDMGNVNDGTTGKTMLQTVKQLIAQVLYAGDTYTRNLKVYTNMSLSDDNSRKRQLNARGNLIFSVSSKIVTVADGNDFKVGTGGAYFNGGLYLGPKQKKGLTGKMTFSDQSWMQFQYGCLVDYEIKSSS